MAAIDISIALNSARLQAVVDFLALGSGDATLAIYSDTRPALGAAPPTPALVSIQLPEPAGTVSSGVLTLGTAAPAMAAESGVATWARIVNGNGDIALDCDVTATAGDGPVKLPSTSLYAGGYVNLISAVLS